MIVIGLLFCEILLQFGSQWFLSVDILTRPPWSEKSLSHNRFIVDPRNGYTGDPSYPEHDDWGFRNQRRPTVADIVTFGDSWTYGTVVPKKDVWPTLLAKMSNRHIYNMAMGGTGLINYLQSFHKSLPLKPKILIASLYFGNDFVITERHFNMDFADTVFDESSRELIHAIKKAEQTGLLNFEYYHNCGLTPNEPKDEHNLKDKDNDVSQIRAWVSRNSRLYGMLRGLKNSLVEMNKREIDLAFQRKVAKLNHEQRRICFPFSDGEWKTVFQNAWRVRTLNYSDARISTGLDVAKKVLNTMKSITMEADAKFLVILFPTKESAFSGIINEMNVSDEDVLDQLRSIFANERFLREDLMEFFVKRKIAYIDLLPYLQGAEQQPFFGSSDSHPNAFGNLVIARAVNDFIDRSDW